MAVVAQAWCDLFVYSTHGYRLERLTLLRLIEVTGLLL